MKQTLNFTSLPQRQDIQHRTNVRSALSFLVFRCSPYMFLCDRVLPSFRVFFCFSQERIYNSFYSRVLDVPLSCYRISLVIVKTSIRFTILVDFTIEIISKVEKMFTSWKTVNISLYWSKIKKKNVKKTVLDDRWCYSFMNSYQQELINHSINRIDVFSKSTKRPKQKIGVP